MDGTTSPSSLCMDPPPKSKRSCSVETHFKNCNWDKYCKMHNLSKWVVTMQREYQKYRSRCHMCQVIIYSIGGKASDVCTRMRGKLDNADTLRFKKKSKIRKMSTPLVHLSMITFYHKLMFIYLSEKWWRCYFQSLVDQCLFDEKAAFFWLFVNACKRIDPIRFRHQNEAWITGNMENE